MPLQQYVQRNLGAIVWTSLKPWYDALDASDDLRLIRRNVDRECDRTDIDQQKWQDFLLDIAAKHSGPDAAQTIDWALGARRTYFTLAGHSIPSHYVPTAVYRLMRLDHFLTYMLLPMPIMPANYATLAADINNKKISGKNLDGKQFGRTDYPIWCTQSPPPKWRATADRARDRFGLKHIDSGHLVEMTYSSSFLQAQGANLKPPTAIDSWASGAMNWIFSKNKAAGGPDWGYTVDMDGGGACDKGESEAVHATFQVPAGQGSSIGLKAYGPLANSAPSVNYGSLLANLNV